MSSCARVVLETGDLSLDKQQAEDCTAIFRRKLESKDESVNSFLPVKTMKRSLFI
jgi:hypothetical protein